MSGIYIHGLSMPKSEHPVWIVVHADGTVEFNEWNEWRTAEEKAIPVPDHGGLVDLKAPFCAQYYDEMTEEWVEKEVTVEDVLFDSMVYDMPPVVIPASKGEPE